MAAMTDGLSEPTDKSIAENEAATPDGARPYRARVVDFAIILKPRVMSLVIFVGLVGLLLAPGTIAPWTGAVAVACISLAAGASGAINMWYDRDIDLNMGRTRDRPIPAGRMAPGHALIMGVILSVASIVTMALVVNYMAAGLLALTVLYYVFIYTVWLKRGTVADLAAVYASKGISARRRSGRPFSVTVRRRSSRPTSPASSSACSATR